MSVAHSTDRWNGLLASLAIKAPCVVATTTNITLSGTQTVNGVALTTGRRVLVKDQTDTTENGIYNVRSSAWERAPDWDGNRDVANGTLISVENPAMLYKAVVTNPAVVGTSAVTFVSYGSDPGDIRNFGAIGDGATDDTAAIQDAIDSFGDAGGEVIVPAGTWLIGRDGEIGGSLEGLDMFCLELKDNVTIRGEGSASILKLAPQAGSVGAPYPIAYMVWSGTITTGLGVVKSTQRKNIQIRHLKLDCDVDNQPSGGTHDVANIRIGECSNVRVQNCELVGGVAETCYILGKHDDEDQTAFIFTNNYVHDTGEWGVDALGVHMDRINGGVCSDNVFYNIGLRAVGLGKCSDVAVTGNWIGRNYDGGVRIAGGDNIVVAGNRMKDCNKYAVEASPEGSDDCFDIDIHSNQIECNASNGEAGIICTNASRLNITGNSITKIQWDGGAAGDRVAGIRVVSQNSVQIEDIVVANNIVRDIDSNYTAGLTTAPTGIYISGHSGFEIDNLQLVNNIVNDAYNGIFVEYIDTMSMSGNLIRGATNTELAVANCVNVHEFCAGKAFQVFASTDATPSVMGRRNFKTANASPTTITMFDDGFDGQEICVVIGDVNTTIDFTGTNLKGNAGADWSPSSGDSMKCVFDGTDWYCDISDNTV